MPCFGSAIERNDLTTSQNAGAVLVADEDVVDRVFVAGAARHAVAAASQEGAASVVDSVVATVGVVAEVDLAQVDSVQVVVVVGAAEVVSEAEAAAADVHDCSVIYLSQLHAPVRRRISSMTTCMRSIRSVCVSVA
jgi:hypothetical protein